MKKSLFQTGISFLFLLLLFSCEDALDGMVSPAYPTGVIIAPGGGVNTHWQFINTTVGKADGDYCIGSNPTTNTHIYITVADGVVVGLWGSQFQAFAALPNTSGIKKHDFELANPTDPIPGQPFACTLPQLTLEGSRCDYFEVFYASDPQTLDEVSIHVAQPKFTRTCIPYTGQFNVYVPMSF